MSKFYNIEGQSVVVESTLSEITQEGFVDSIKAGVKALKKKILELLKALLEKVIKWLDDTSEQNVEKNAEHKRPDKSKGYDSSGSTLYSYDLYAPDLIDGVIKLAKKYVDKANNLRLYDDDNEKAFEALEDMREGYEVIKDKIDNIKNNFKQTYHLSIAEAKQQVKINKFYLTNLKELISDFKRSAEKLPERFSESNQDLKSEISSIAKGFEQYISLLTSMVNIVEENIGSLGGYTVKDIGF